MTLVAKLKARFTHNSRAIVLTTFGLLAFKLLVWDYSPGDVTAAFLASVAGYLIVGDPR
jgi:hypothetical protein